MNKAFYGFAVGGFMRCTVLRLTEKPNNRQPKNRKKQTVNR
jgi:hypothetical protein